MSKPVHDIRQAEDLLFRALADSARRRLLDRLRLRGGQTLGELSEGMEMTRQGVAKHLALLEQAGIVTSLRQGREKLHYLNPLPIHRIARRWIRPFENGRLDALEDLKDNLER